jgi:hypothetical protein
MRQGFSVKETLWLSLLASLLVCSSLTHAAAVKIDKRLVIVYEEKNLGEYVKGYLQHVLFDTTVSVLKVSANDFDPRLLNIKQDDMVVVLGMNVYKQLYKFDIANPILLLFTQTAEYRAFQKSHSANNFVVPIFMDQPVGRLAKFVSIALPNENRFSFLVGPASKQIKGLIKKEFAKYGADTEFVDISGEANPIDAIEKLLYRQGVIIAIPDEDVYTPSNTKWLLYKAHQTGVPVIGFSSAFVRAGAIATVFTSVDQIMKQTAELIKTTLESKEDSLTFSRRVFYPKYFSVEFNDSAYRSQNRDHPEVSTVMRELREGGKFAATYQ